MENELVKHPDLKNHRIRTEFYNDGARMRRNYCFYEIFTEIEPGDSVNPELQLFNSCDYQIAQPLIVRFDRS